MSSRATLSDQRLQVGFETRAVLTCILEDQLDQTALAGTKVSMDATPRQSVEQRNGLLGKELFELVGGHHVVKC